LGGGMKPEEADGRPRAVEVRRETQMQQCNSRRVVHGDVASARFPRDCTGLICPGAVSGQLPDIRRSTGKTHIPATGLFGNCRGENGVCIGRSAPACVQRPEGRLMVTFSRYRPATRIADAERVGVVLGYERQP
jgi:hypothetical protein